MAATADALVHGLMVQGCEAVCSVEEHSNVEVNVDGSLHFL